MGRRTSIEAIESRVRDVRVAGGLSQAALAARAGLTRQAISAIESGAYVPNTAVALRLAQVLSCRVEDLYGLPEPVVQREVFLAGDQAAGLTRLAVGRVRDRLIGHPLLPGRDIQEGFVSAEGLLAGPSAGNRTGGPALADLLVSPDRVERTALLMGCDPSLGILSAHLQRRSADAELVWLNGPSEAALKALQSGEVHLAGSHLRDPRTGEYNLPFARAALAGVGGLVVAFARWEQGLIVPAGNPKGIRRAEDLARPDVTIVNREPGAGSRAMLDDLLERADIPPDAVRGYERTAASHFALARTIASGSADAGIGLRAAAQAFGLEFVPLAEVHFDLVIPNDQLDHPVVARLLDVLHSRRLRSELAALAGYDVSRLGTVTAEVPAA